ncbi:MAG: hypothetical protein DLM53_12735 [Candidatus Eremiobacter antarcticus]|nr:MAG: hypothetical protein DLM53_12735 [Candidatus Eremiobacter sp. RRmetagenome_bin22]
MCGRTRITNMNPIKIRWTTRAVFITGVAALMLSCAPAVRENKSPSVSHSNSMQALSRASALSLETAAPAESNPPGDIPDKQAFVRYTSRRGHYAVDAPEGWSRTIAGASVEFRDKYDGESVRLMLAPRGSLSANAVASIQRGSHAAHVGRITTTRAGGRSQTLIFFVSNSDANPVTGKRVRLDNEAVVYLRGNRAAMLTLWAPSGSDNTDQWNRIVSSFRWL